MIVRTGNEPNKAFLDDHWSVIMGNGHSVGAGGVSRFGAPINDLICLKRFDQRCKRNTKFVEK